MTRLTGLMLALVLAALTVIAAGAATSDDTDEVEGGIVGTGIMPAGILGVITQLGSIHVLGQRVVFDDAFSVDSALGPQPASDLVPGDVVAVLADPMPEGPDWQARAIERIFGLIGPVEAAGDGTFTVLGTRVLGDADGLEPGSWVAVSGFWQGMDFDATRVERIAPRASAVVQGSWRLMDGTPVIGGSVLTGIRPAHADPGAVLRAEGTPVPGGIDAERLSFGTFPGSPGVVLAEGYLSMADASGLYIQLGSGLVDYTDNPGMIDPAERVLRCGMPDPDATLPDGLSDRLGCAGRSMMDPATAN